MRRRRRPAIRRMGAMKSQQVGPAAQKLLRRGHQLLEKGEHTRAAEIFERLARGAEDRGMLRHAPNLYLQAARANLLSGKQKEGTDLIYCGLNILAGGKRWPALARAGRRVITEIEELGHQELAGEISKWLSSNLPKPLESYPQTQPQKAQLPLKCPSCGGALRPDEVEYLDSTTGECPYCGSAIRGN